MDKRDYFPVGEEASIEVLKNFSWSDLQKRSLNDPHYAGCETNFDWHKYIVPKFSDSILEKEVTAVLDQIAQTPEGQQTIRQAYAMGNHRIATGQTGFAYDQEKPLYVTDSLFTPQMGFITPKNAINIFKDDLLTKSMLASDGTYRHISLTAAIYHELCHAKDGFDTQIQADHFHKANARELRQDKEITDALGDQHPASRVIQEKQSSIYEYPVIRETNEFMQKYFGEVPRAMRHNDNVMNTPENERTGKTLPEPHLPHGIDYSNVPNLPVPNCKASVTALKR